MDGHGLRPRNGGKGGRNPESTDFMGIEALLLGYSVVRYRFGGGVTGDKPLAVCRVFYILRNAYMHKRESGHAEENDDHHG